jgi:hypothetical protein
MPEKWPDDVKRISDAMNLHAVCGKSMKWVAYALADGSSPDSHTTYDTREEAVLYRRWDRDNYFYLQVQPDGMSLEAADGFLRYARMLHDNGYRLPDPRDFNSASASGDQDFPVHSSVPLLAADRRAQILELTKRKSLKKG